MWRMSCASHSMHASEHVISPPRLSPCPRHTCTHMGDDHSFLCVATVLFIYLLFCVKTVGSPALKGCGFGSHQNFGQVPVLACIGLAMKTYSRPVSYENGCEIYSEITCDALLQVTGNLIHSAFKKKKKQIYHLW